MSLKLVPTRPAPPVPVVRVKQSRPKPSSILSTRQTVTFVIALSIFVLISNCDSPLWLQIRKIKEVKYRQFIADNLHIIGNVALLSPVFWEGSRFRIDYAALTAFAMFLLGSTTHPVDVACTTAVLLLARHYLPRKSKTMVTLLAVAIAFALHLGMTFTQFFGPTTFEWPNCTVA